MPRDDSRGQGDRGGNKKQRGQQGRPGDVVLDDSFIKRFAFRAFTDVIGDLGEGAASIPLIRAASDVFVAALGPRATQLLVTGTSSIVQNPEWIVAALTAAGLGGMSPHYAAEVIDEAFDGIRRSIRPEKVGDDLTHWVNLNEADKAIAEARENNKALRPPPIKSYLELFMALDSGERAVWDQILAAFTLEQKEKFAMYRGQFTSVTMLRAAIEIADAASDDDVAVRAVALLAFLERHFEVKKPAAVDKVGSFVGDFSKKVKASLEKTFQVLPIEDRNERHLKTMAEIADRRLKYK